MALLAGGARVVKAFNTTGAENMAKAHDFPSKPWMPVAGDDAQAKAVVRKLAEELGFEAIDAGPLKMSRYLEPMAMQWIKLAYEPAIRFLAGSSLSDQAVRTAAVARSRLTGWPPSSIVQTRIPAGLDSP